MTAEIVAPAGRLSDETPIERASKHTYKGMASWAGMGPPGMTCRECIFYNSLHRDGWKYERGKGTPPLKDHYCHKRKNLGYQLGDPFPHHAMACRYFEPSSSPPKALR